MQNRRWKADRNDDRRQTTDDGKDPRQQKRRQTTDHGR